MTNYIVNCYWNVCLLRNSPEHTPYSISWMFISAVFLALLLVIEWNFSYFNSSGTITNTACMALCLVASYIFYTYLILYFKGLAPRLVQTVTCLYCINIITHILVIPLLFLAPYLSQIHLKNPLSLSVGLVYLFLSLALSVWQFVITAHIYKFALDTTAIQSVLAAFSLIAVNILSVSLFIGR